MAEVEQDAARIPQFEPLTSGAILDRTISLYIRNFVLFFGIMLIPQALSYANGIVLGKSLGWSNRLTTVLYVLVYIVIYLLSFAAGTGAATVAISSRYLDREISVAAAYRQGLRRIGSIMGAWIVAVILIGLVFLGVLVGWTVLFGVSSAIHPTIPPVLAALLPWLLILAAVFSVGRMLASYCLITPANVLENCSARQSRRRSRLLTRGTRWLILGIFLLYTSLSMIASYGLTLLVNLAMGISPRLLFTAGQNYIHYLVRAPLQFLFAPIPAILVVLIYYNQRIRKEGYDLVLLADALAGTRDSNYNRRGSQE
jgi:hypothetical protein